VCGDGDGGEEVVRLGVEGFEEGGDVEAVDEEGAAAGAACVREEVEELEAAGVGLCFRRVGGLEGDMGGGEYMERK
jgi:hypothetical protein